MSSVSHAAASIEPADERRRFAAAFATLNGDKQSAAAEIVSTWPRLIHHLALRGELATPWIIKAPARS